MSKKVLIVEDEVATYLALEQQLESSPEGYTVSRLDGEEESLQNWLSSPQAADVAIVDLQLPCSSGIDPDAGLKFTATLERKQPGLPVIILTTRNDEHSWENAKKLANVKYLIVKPWNKRDLLSAIVKCLAGHVEGIIPIGRVRE